MKLRRLIILVTTVLLYCLESWSMNLPSTGSSQNADTTITITISEVREINKKLIERKYLLKITETQDSIINSQAEYIKEQEKIVNDTKSALANKESLHNTLNKKYSTVKYTAIALGIALTISLVLNIIK